MTHRSMNKKICLAALLLVTALTRIYYVLEHAPINLSHDEIGYHQMARQLLDKGVFGYYSETPNAFVTPGYPLFLAALYSLARGINTDPLVAARIIQAIIGAVTLYLVYRIARYSMGFKGSMTAAVLVAVYPPSFMAAGRILTEVLFSCLLLCYILSLMKAFKDNTLKGHIYSGLIMGIAVLVRPALAPFLPVPYIASLALGRDPRILRGMAVAVVMFCLVLSPWWVRNYLIFDKFIPLATQTGNPLLRGTDPYDPYDKIGPSILAGVPENQMTQTAMSRIKQGFKQEPLYWLQWFTIGKFQMLWQRPWGNISSFTVYLHLIVFFILGWIGTLVNLGDRNLRWAALVILVMTLTQLAFIPIERYMYPMTPLMAVMSTSLLIKIIQRDLTLGS